MYLRVIYPVAKNIGIVDAINKETNSTFLAFVSDVDSVIKI
jgi:hypothetical protein